VSGLAFVNSSQSAVDADSDVRVAIDDCVFQGLRGGASAPALIVRSFTLMTVSRCVFLENDVNAMVFSGTLELHQSHIA
jgi:hypothetical protein